MRAIIVNLTQHPLQFEDGAIVPPTDVDFYAEGTHKGVDFLDIEGDGAVKRGTTQLMTICGGFRNLPEPAKNTYYVVGNRTAELLRGFGIERDDIYVPVYNGSHERNIIGLLAAL